MLGFLSGTFLHDLRTQKLRLTLTLFGIVWGTLAVVVLLAFGTGLERKAAEVMDRGQTVVSLRSGTTRMPFRGLPPQRPIRLLPEDAAVLRSLPEIALASEVSSMSKQVAAASKTSNSTLMGVEPDYGVIFSLELEPRGRFISARDLHERRRVAVLGVTARNELFGRADAVGRQVRVGSATYTVIGVIAPRNPEGFSGRDTRVLIPATTYRVANQTRRISSVVYSPASPQLAERALQRAFETLGSRHRFDPADRRALQHWDTTEMEQEVRYFLLGLKLFLAVVGGFTLLVGGIGVANIMFVVVRERRIEIGVKRAMGARRSHILLQFLFEAMLLVAAGALIGFLLAAGVVELLGLIPATEEMGQPVISASVAAGTTLVLAIVALAAGVFPARAAARLDPVTCLRG